MIVQFAKPIFDREMENAAADALHNEKFVLGESVFKFEEEFARYCGVKHAVSTNSGTSAIQLSLLALGIKEIDEIITTPASFIGTANAILHTNAIPVFADIDHRTYTIDPKLIEKKITKKTKAIIPVHLYGRPADISRIMEISERNGVRVIEDACQAHGAEYNGSKVGAIGDVGCFSFYSTKNLTVCGDGGMIITDNEETAKIARKLRDCGRLSHSEHDAIGFTARLNTVNAAVGRVQLKRLDQWNEKRRKHAKLYNYFLSGIKELTLPTGEHRVKHVYHLYAIRTDLRDRLKHSLEKNGISCNVHYSLPIHLQPIYRDLFGYREGDFPESESLSSTVLSLPMFPDLTEEEIEFVCEKIIEFYVLD